MNWRKKPLEVTHMGNFKFHKAHFLCTTNSRRRVSLGRYVHTVGDTYKDDDWVFWASRATLVEEALSLSSLSLPLRSHHRHSLLSIFRCLFCVICMLLSPLRRPQFTPTRTCSIHILCTVWWIMLYCRVAVEMKCCLQWIRPRCLVYKSVFPGTSLGWI